MLKQHENGPDDDYLDNVVRNSEYTPNYNFEPFAETTAKESRQGKFPKKGILKNKEKRDRSEIEMEDAVEEYFRPGPMDQTVTSKSAVINNLYKNHINTKSGTELLTSKKLAFEREALNSDKFKLKTLTSKTEATKIERKSKIDQLNMNLATLINMPKENYDYLNQIFEEVKQGKHVEYQPGIKRKFEPRVETPKIDDPKPIESSVPRMGGEAPSVEEPKPSNFNRNKRIMELQAKFEENKIKAKNSKQDKRFSLKPTTSSSEEETLDGPTFEVILGEDEKGNVKLGIKNHNSISTYKPLNETEAENQNRTNGQKNSLLNTQTSNKNETGMFEKYLPESTRVFSNSDVSELPGFRPSNLSPGDNQGILNSYAPNVQQAVRNLKPVNSNPKFKSIAKRDPEDDLPSIMEERHSLANDMKAEKPQYRGSVQLQNSKHFDSEYAVSIKGGAFTKAKKDSFKKKSQGEIDLNSDESIRAYATQFIQDLGRHSLNVIQEDANVQEDNDDTYEMVARKSLELLTEEIIHEEEKRIAPSEQTTSDSREKDHSEQFSINDENSKKAANRMLKRYNNEIKQEEMPDRAKISIPPSPKLDLIETDPTDKDMKDDSLVQTVRQSLKAYENEFLQNIKRRLSKKDMPDFPKRMSKEVNDAENDLISDYLTQTVKHSLKSYQNDLLENVKRRISIKGSLEPAKRASKQISDQDKQELDEYLNQTVRHSIKSYQNEFIKDVKRRLSTKDIPDLTQGCRNDGQTIHINQISEGSSETAKGSLKDTPNETLKKLIRRISIKNVPDLDIGKYEENESADHEVLDDYLNTNIKQSLKTYQNDFLKDIKRRISIKDALTVRKRSSKEMDQSEKAILENYLNTAIKDSINGYQNEEVEQFREEINSEKIDRPALGKRIAMDDETPSDKMQAEYNISNAVRHSIKQLQNKPVTEPKRRNSKRIQLNSPLELSTTLAASQKDLLGNPLQETVKNSIVASQGDSLSDDRRMSNHTLPSMHHLTHQNLEKLDKSAAENNFNLSVKKSIIAHERKRQSENLGTILQTKKGGYFDDIFHQPIRPLSPSSQRHNHEEEHRRMSERTLPLMDIHAKDWEQERKSFDDHFEQAIRASLSHIKTGFAPMEEKATKMKKKKQPVVEYEEVVGSAEKTLADTNINRIMKNSLTKYENEILDEALKKNEASKNAQQDSNGFFEEYFEVVKRQSMQSSQNIPVTASEKRVSIAEILVTTNWDKRRNSFDQYFDQTVRRSIVQDQSRFMLDELQTRPFQQQHEPTGSISKVKSPLMISVAERIEAEMKRQKEEELAIDKTFADEYLQHQLRYSIEVLEKEELAKLQQPGEPTIQSHSSLFRNRMMSFEDKIKQQLEEKAKRELLHKIDNDFAEEYLNQQLSFSIDVLENEIVEKETAEPKDPEMEQPILPILNHDQETLINQKSNNVKNQENEFKIHDSNNQENELKIDDSNNQESQIQKKTGNTEKHVHFSSGSSDTVINGNEQAQGHADGVTGGTEQAQGQADEATPEPKFPNNSNGKKKDKYRPTIIDPNVFNGIEFEDKIKAEFEDKSKAEFEDKIKAKFDALPADQKYMLEVEYKNRVMLVMNDLLEKKQFAKTSETTKLLKEKMKQMVKADFLYYCSQISEEDVEKIVKLQNYARKIIIKNIMNRVRFSNMEFTRVKSAMEVRRTKAFGLGSYTPDATVVPGSKP